MLLLVDQITSDRVRNYYRVLLLPKQFCLWQSILLLWELVLYDCNVVHCLGNIQNYDNIIMWGITIIAYLDLMFLVIIAGRVCHMLDFDDLRLRSRDNLRSVRDPLHGPTWYVPWRSLSFSCLVSLCFSVSVAFP